jgi:hypothetical protein
MKPSDSFFSRVSRPPLPRAATLLLCAARIKTWLTARCAKSSIPQSSFSYYLFLLLPSTHPTLSITFTMASLTATTASASTCPYAAALKGQKPQLMFDDFGIRRNFVSS